MKTNFELHCSHIIYFGRVIQYFEIQVLSLSFTYLFLFFPAHPLLGSCHQYFETRLLSYFLISVLYLFSYNSWVTLYCPHIHYSGRVTSILKPDFCLIFLSLFSIFFLSFLGNIILSAHQLFWLCHQYFEIRLLSYFLISVLYLFLIIPG